MNYKIIIILVFLIFIIIGSILTYFFIIKSKAPPQPSVEPPPQPSVEPPPQPSVEPPPQPSVEPPPQPSVMPIIDKTPKDASCSSNGSVIDGKSVDSITSENKDENYTFDIMRLGRDIKTNIERFMFPERFALSLPPTIVLDKNSLVNDTYYFIGSIKPESQITTRTPSINGGRDCLQFPTIIYKNSGIIGPITNTFLISTRDWYPYGASASFLKSVIGITDLTSAINYASNNGYTAFSFNPNISSTDPNDINNRILFFKEADINLTTFWTNGASVQGFRIYAVGFSKLGTCPTDSIFNTTTGDCICNPGFQKAPGRTGRNDPCQCIQQPYYESYPNHDIGGNDILPCLQNPGGGWPAWANEAKARCDNNPNCKAYNIIHRYGTWGNNWGSCMKTTTARPTAGANKIDYFKKAEGILSKDSDGVCRPPCPTGQTRDANGVCQWPPCPANSTVNQTTGQCTCNSGFEVALAGYYPGSTGRTSVDRNQRCDRPCAAGVRRDVDGVCGGSADIKVPLNFFNPGAR
jgi:hypothetical protein